MNKTVYLHIGAQKTGTTSIQKSLYENADALAKSGYCVPKGLHADLPLSLIGDHYHATGACWPPFWPAVNATADEVWSAFMDQIKCSDCDRAIISAENFCDLIDYIPDGGHDPFGDRIKSYLSGFDVRVVVYVRPIADHVNSMYKEMVKISSEIRSEENVLCGMHKNKRHAFFPTRYLDYFSDLFGKDAMVVRRYARPDFPRGDVVCDFLDTVGYPGGDKLASQVLHENMSIPDGYVQLKRLFNTVGIEDVTLNQLMAKYLIRVNSVTAPGGKRRDCSYDTLNQEIARETGRFWERYGVDLASETRLEAGDAPEIGHADGFLIAMLAHLMGQNERLLARLDAIEARLGGRATG